MEWLTCIRKTIEIIENNLKSNLSAQDIAKEVYLSPFFLQKGFSVLTGYTLSEYMRNRKLYEAGIELQKTDTKVIDIAYDYGYETPESFTKAFTRFHGVSPTQVRLGANIRTFLPLKMSINLYGGNQMNVKITKLFPFKVIGFTKEFTFENAHAEIPKFWDEICEKYAKNIYAGNPPANPLEKALMDNCIGEYGVCIDNLQNGKILYMIAGKYTGGEIPEGLTLYEFPAGEWAIFECIGPIPKAIQDMSDRVFKEWLPNNPDYEICGNASIEWYDCVNGETTDEDYRSAIWLPIKRKN